MNNSEFQKKFSDRWKGYLHDPDIKTVRIRYEKLRAWIEEEGKGKTILDIGCADGTLMEPLVDHHTIYGIEISDHLLEEAKIRGLRAVKGDVEQGIPFKPKMFDIVIAAEIVEHIVNTDFFLSECNRVLKRNGKLIVCVPNINTLFSPLILLLFDYPPPGSSRYRSHHVKDFTRSTLRIALQNNGFEVEQERGVVFFIPLFDYWLKLRSLLGNLFPRASDELIVKAKKKRSVTYDEDKVIEGIESRSVIKAMPILKWFFKA